jgi:tight adherence protein B
MRAELLVAAPVAMMVLSVGAALAPRHADEADRERPNAVRRRRGVGAGSRTAPVLGAFAGAATGFVVAGWPGAVIVGVGGAAAPVGIARRRRARLAARIEEQMLDLVTSLASAVRAGRSLEQALALAGAELDPPLGPTVTAISDRTALGVPFDGAVQRWADELGSAEARLTAGVVLLHRRTGGALAGPLDELATTLRARRAAARELRSLTAQARLSAAILGLLPVGFFLFLSAVSRRDIEQAISTPAGAGAIGVGLALQAAAFAWIRALLRVDA